MKHVNIYTMTNLRGIRRQDGERMCILEYKQGKDPATLSIRKKSINQTPNEAELQVVLDALSRLKEPCEVSIYTESLYFYNTFKQWLPKWEKDGFITTKKELIRHAEKWKEMSEYSHTHNITILTGEAHEYRAWMKKELER